MKKGLLIVTAILCIFCVGCNKSNNFRVEETVVATEEQTTEVAQVPAETVESEIAESVENETIEEKTEEVTEEVVEGKRISGKSHWR